MKFDIDKVGVDFQNIIEWMLKGQFGLKIKEDLRRYQELSDEFSTTPDPDGALKLLVTTKVTNAWYRDEPPELEADFKSFTEKHKKNFRTSQSMDELATMIRTHSVFPLEDQKAKDWVEKLFSYQTLGDFTDELYGLRRKGKKSKVLGNKGADHYLRGIGKWEVVPIDIHERRFLVRTGIFHAFSLKGRLDERSLQDAVSQFCSLYLKGKTVESVDLGSAPGIVDLFIWSYCSDERYRICGSTPRCEVCGLKDACFLSIANTKKAISQGQGYGSRISKTQLSLTTDSPEKAKKRLAEQYIKDTREKRLFLRTNDKDIHDWGPYIAGLVLTQRGQATFERKDICSILRDELIPDIYNKKYVRESRVLPADNCWNCVQSSRDNEFPCLKAVSKSGKGYQYRFLGFGKALKKKLAKFRTDLLRQALSNYQGG